MVFDFIFSIWIIYLFYSGYKRGLIKQLSTIIALVTSWYVALSHTDTFIGFLENRFSLLNRMTSSLERMLLRQNPNLFGMKITEEGIREFINSLPSSQYLKDLLLSKVAELTNNLYPLILGSVIGRFLATALLGILSFLLLFFLTKWLLNFSSVILTKILKSLSPIGFVNFLLGGLYNLCLYGLLLIILSSFFEALIYLLLPGPVSTQLDKSIIFNTIRYLSEQGIINKMIIFLYSQLINLWQ